MSTLWWIVVVALTFSLAFSLGFIAHAEWVLWLRCREPSYTREFDLTHTSRGVR